MRTLQQTSDIMKETKQRYWICVIGPTDQNKLPSGSDSPMRKAVTKTFKKITKHEDQDCYSGWGNDEERMKLVQYVWCIDKDNPFYKKILEMIEKDQKRYDEITSAN